MIASVFVLAAAIAACAPSERNFLLASAGDRPSPRDTSGYVEGSSSIGNYLAGRHAQTQSDYASAADYLSRALQGDPKNRELTRRAHAAFLASGRMKDARALADKVLELDKGDTVANLDLIAGDIKRRDFASAEQRLAKMPRRGAASLIAPLLTAWVKAGEKDYQAAIAALAPLKSAAGLGMIYDLHEGFIHELADNTESAAASYLAAMVRNERSLRAVEALGTLYERTGRSAEAKKLYERFAEEAPEVASIDLMLARVAKREKPQKLVPDALAGAAEAFFNISNSLVRENSADMALVFGWLAVDLNPNLGQGLLLIAGIYETLNRYDDAIRVYGMVTANSPWRWNAQIREALVNDAADRTDMAVALLRAMIAEQPTRAEAATSLGDVLRGRKRFVEAADAYDTAMARSNPSEQRNWTLYYSRGIALERANLWQRAEADFLKALELNPEQPHVLNYLGYSWVEHGVNLDRARKMLERAVELRPNDGYIVDSLGWVLFRTGDFKGAAERLEHAVELRPQDATINDHLGDAYWKVGRHTEARFQWSRALSLDPEPELVDSIKTKIARGLQGVAAKRGG